MISRVSAFSRLPRRNRAFSGLLSRPRRLTSTSAVPVNMTTNAGVRTHPSLEIVSTQRAPVAIGPYCQAMKIKDLLFVSGSLGFDPTTMQIVEGGIELQTEQALKNLQAIVEDGGSSLGRVVKTTLFLKSMDDFATVNGIYARFFGSHTPARSTVEVARLPKDALFEIECIASLE